MLEISPKIVADVGLSVTDVANYLIQHGWQQVTSQNDRLQVFQGINDDLGNPIM
jgi:membrane-bound lytic murein transglycosylase B